MCAGKCLIICEFLAHYNGLLLRSQMVELSREKKNCLFPFRWFINKKKLIGDYTTEMILHNATRDLHDATVKCEVSNDVGKSEESQTLDIRCKC